MDKRAALTISYASYCYPTNHWRSGSLFNCACAALLYWLQPECTDGPGGVAHMQQFTQSLQSSEQQQAGLELMQEMQLKGMQRLFIGVSDKCFTDCITSFRTKTLNPREQACVHNCAHRFMTSLTRVVRRVEEEAQAKMQQQQQRQ
eukprot:g69217.t1